MSSPTALILLDACRGEYLERGLTPFLSAMGDEGFCARRVRPSWGFCERAEILTGRDAVESGYFAAIGFAPESSPYRGWASALSFVTAIARAVPHPLEAHWSRVVRFALKRWGPAKPYRIPFEWLPKFAFTEDRFPPDHPDAYGGGSLISAATEHGFNVDLSPFTYLGSRSSLSDSGRLEVAARSLDGGATDLALIYLAELDAVGHRFGPESRELDDALVRADRTLERWVRDRRAIHPDLNVIIVGDHGMHAVQGELFVHPLLETLGRENRGNARFWWFLDSTLLRLWCADSRDVGFARNLVGEAFPDPPQGRLLDGRELAAIDPERDRAFGDVVFACNPGWVLSPDFFRGSNVPAGMHGYHPDHDFEKGVCIASGGEIQRSTVPEIPLTHVHEIIRTCLSIDDRGQGRHLKKSGEREL